MSAYVEQETQIRDQECLVEALKNKGYSTVESHDKAENLVGYHGDQRKNTAEVIVRRKHIGSSSNDLGFKKQEDGTFKAVISQYDSAKHNAKWLDSLKQEYAKLAIKKQARKAGLRFKAEQKTPNGGYRMVFVRQP